MTDLERYCPVWIQKPISTISEFDDSLAQCFSAKNALVRVNGFSPLQLVLGKTIRVPASLTSCDSAASHEMAVADGLEDETFSPVWPAVLPPASLSRI